MRADVRQRVWRRRKSPSHADSVLIAATAGRLRLEVGAHLFHRRCELLPAPRAGPYQTVAAAQQQPMPGRPSCVVVRTLGVPHHHIRQAKS